MTDAATQQPPTPPATRQPGTTFDIVEVEVLADGTKKFRNRGAVFIRANGTGGVVYLRQGEAKQELALFPRKPRG